MVCMASFGPCYHAYGPSAVRLQLNDNICFVDGKKVANLGLVDPAHIFVGSYIF